MKPTSPDEGPHTLTSLLEAGVQTPDDEALLWTLVYDELRGIAKGQLFRSADTIAPTALVNELFVKLGGGAAVSGRGRAYFFASAARAMRQILVDHARHRSRDKRGGGARPVTLETGHPETDGFSTEVLDLERALVELEELNPRHARVVECRYFAGLTVPETAEALDVSPRTVKNDWALSRAWLFRRLGRDREA